MPCKLPLASCPALFPGPRPRPFTASHLSPTFWNRCPSGQRTRFVSKTFSCLWPKATTLDQELPFGPGLPSSHSLEGHLSCSKWKRPLFQILPLCP